MKSFVDSFADKHISASTLKRMLDVPYQQEALLQIVMDNPSAQSFAITICSDYVIRLQSPKCTINILLSSDTSSLAWVKKNSNVDSNKTITLVFKKTKKFDVIDNRVYINKMDWMNRIISHGINRQILDLQYLRDMEFYFENPK